MNSKRLTTAHLRQLGEALKLPTSGSGEELRQLIEGKLSEPDDHNIQVVVQETPRTETVLWLVDTEGSFLQTPPSYRDSKDSSQAERICQELTESDTQLSEELATIQQQLDEALLQLEGHTAEDSSRLAAEVDHLKEELKTEKDKRKQVWKTSCEQVAEQDALLTAKDEKIAALQLRVAGLTPRATPHPHEEEGGGRVSILLLRETQGQGGVRPHPLIPSRERT